MIVIKSTAEYAATVRRVAGEQPSYRADTRSDLNEAAVNDIPIAHHVLLGPASRARRSPENIQRCSGL